MHLNGPHIDFSTHIADVVNCITYEELENVILVGHSYAGMVITGAAQQIAEKISHLIYLDAVIPRDGETTLDAMGGLQLDPDTKMFRAKSGTDFGITDPADAAWIERRVTQQSGGTLREPLVVQHALPRMRRTYIGCTADAEAAHRRTSCAAPRLRGSTRAGATKRSRPATMQ